MGLARTTLSSDWKARGLTPFHKGRKFSFWKDNLGTDVRK